MTDLPPPLLVIGQKSDSVAPQLVRREIIVNDMVPAKVRAITSGHAVTLDHLAHLSAAGYPPTLELLFLDPAAYELTKAGELLLQNRRLFLSRPAALGCLQWIRIGASGELDASTSLRMLRTARWVGAMIRDRERVVAEPEPDDRRVLRELGSLSAMRRWLLATCDRYESQLQESPLRPLLAYSGIAQVLTAIPRQAAAEGTSAARWRYLKATSDSFSEPGCEALWIEGSRWIPFRPAGPPETRDGVLGVRPKGQRDALPLDHVWEQCQI